MADAIMTDATMAEHQPVLYTIFCLVIGEDAFPVEIRPDATVYELKKEINAEKKLVASEHASNLKLFKVNIEDDDDLVEKAKQHLNTQPPPKPLRPTNKLSALFTEAPAEETVHILVQIPQTDLSPPPIAPTTLSNDRKRLREDEDAVIPTVKPFKRRKLSLLPQSKTIYKTEANPENPGAPVLLPTQGGFHEITSLYNLIAADKTNYIEFLDKSPKYQYMFLRPRRWGKSTFLQTLTDYYDKAKKDRFNDIFGDLYIGKHHTSGRNSLLVLRFDFSTVSGTSTPNTMREQFDRMINDELKRFLEQSQAFLGGLNLELVDNSDGAKSLMEVLRLVERKGERLFVGVDEYDAPANTVIFDPDDNRYQVVAEFFKTSFFAIMKQATSTVVDKYWITGVLPVFRDGISPLNATQIISDKPGYNGLCGLTDTEVREIAQTYLSSYKSEELEHAVEQLKRWYNGYLFCREKQVESLYNPQLVFNHLRGLANEEVRLVPLEEINAIHMSSVLAALPDTGDASFFESYLSMINSTIEMAVAHQFGAAEVRQRGKDTSMTWTLLYFLGVLTHDPDGRHLKAPNVTMINVITRRFSKFLNRKPGLATKSNAAYEGLMTGNVGPLVKLLEVFFGEEPARAVKDCNEATLRMALTAFWSSPAGKCLPELSIDR